MLHLLSFAFFAGVAALSIGVIVATIKSELPLILKALGFEPMPYAPLPPEGARREREVRVIRQARLLPKPQALRAA